jgi:hypothetical protein
VPGRVAGLKIERSILSGMRNASPLLISTLFLCVLAANGQPAKTASEQKSAVQPAHENLDLGTIERIRMEGIWHSHIMEYASGLFDGVGPRLTGSHEFERAAQWSIEQLRRMGASNPHEESWGDFGMGWTQAGTSVLMTEPSTGTILAQATP